MVELERRLMGNTETSVPDISEQPPGRLPAARPSEGKNSQHFPHPSRSLVSGFAYLRENVNIEIYVCALLSFFFFLLVCAGIL